MHTAPVCFKVVLCLCFMVLVLSSHEATGRNYQIVIVLDMSAAMQLQNRIVKLKLAVQEWIIDLVPNGVLLSIVQLSSCFAKALCHLTEVNTTTRMKLAEHISEDAVGEVCIGCGLHMAMQELGGITESSAIILVCGNENQEPGEDIQDVLKEETANVGRVVAVALGNSAPKEELKLLANRTQGLFFDVSDDGSAEDLKATFQAALDLLMFNLDANNVDVNMTESPSLNLTTTSVPTEAASSQTICSTTHNLDQISSKHVVAWVVLSVLLVVVIIFVVFVCTLRKHYLNHGFYHVTRQKSQLL